MFEELIEEAFNNASYMDVSELRLLYYGRLNIFVSFTDNDEFVMSEEGRPDGIVCHAVDEVVGRKVSTPLLYGRVFRINKAGRFVEDIRAHSSETLADDIEAIRLLPYLKPVVVEAVISAVMSNVRLRRPFVRLWELTKQLSRGDGALWQKILVDIGYRGFTDPYGIGLIGKRRSPVTLLLDVDERQDFDIVPMQKYRVDPRTRVRDDVNRAVKKLQPARNRVAKVKTPENRDVKPSKSFISSILWPL